MAYFVARKLGTMRQMVEFFDRDYEGEIEKYIERMEDLEEKVRKLSAWLSWEVKVLKELSRIKLPWIIHHDDIIPRVWIRGRPVQIDHMFVSTRCIYVIETKSWSKKYVEENPWCVDKAIKSIKDKWYNIYKFFEENWFKWIKTKEILVFAWQYYSKERYKDKVDITGYSDFLNRIYNYEALLEENPKASYFTEKQLINISKFIRGSWENPALLEYSCD